MTKNELITCIIVALVGAILLVSVLQGIARLRHRIEARMETLLKEVD